MSALFGSYIGNFSGIPSFIYMYRHICNIFSGDRGGFGWVKRRMERKWSLSNGSKRGHSEQRGERI